MLIMRRVGEDLGARRSPWGMENRSRATLNNRAEDPHPRRTGAKRYIKLVLVLGLFLVLTASEGLLQDLVDGNKSSTIVSAHAAHDACVVFNKMGIAPGAEASSTDLKNFFQDVSNAGNTALQADAEAIARSAQPKDQSQLERAINSVFAICRRMGIGS